MNYRDYRTNPRDLLCEHQLERTGSVLESPAADARSDLDQQAETSLRSGLSVLALGTFNFSAAGHQVTRWQAGKARLLLVYLLLNKGRVITKEALYEALWPTMQASAESSSLKVAVHVLRGALGRQNERVAQFSAREDSPYLRVITHDFGYILESNAVWVDFEAFDDLTSRANAARLQGDLQTMHALYAGAVDLYKGDFMPGVDMDWVEAHRVWLRGTALIALEAMVEADLQRDEWQSVINNCQRLLDIEPFREETYRTLIRVHARLGHLTQAKLWYDICCTRVRDSLQIDVEAATTRVLERAMRGEFR